VESIGDGILGSSNRTRGNQNGRRKGIGLANSKRSSRYTEVFGISELLLSVY